jgi:hypothetical protein
MRDRGFSISYSTWEIERVERNRILHGLKFSDYVRACLRQGGAAYIEHITQERGLRDHRRGVVLTQEEVARLTEDALIACVSRAQYVRARTVQGFPRRSPGRVLQRIVGEIEEERKKMGLTEHGLLKLMRRVKMINGEYQCWDGRKLVVLKPWRYAEGGTDEKESVPPPPARRQSAKGRQVQSAERGMEGVCPADLLVEADEGEGEGGRVSLFRSRSQEAQDGGGRPAEGGMKGVSRAGAEVEGDEGGERGGGRRQGGGGERESGSVPPLPARPQSAKARQVQSAERGMEGVCPADLLPEADEGEGGSGSVPPPSALSQTAGSRRGQPAEGGSSGVLRAGAKVQADEESQPQGDRRQGGEGGRVSPSRSRSQEAKDGRGRPAERGIKGVPSPSARAQVAQGRQARPAEGRVRRGDEKANSGDARAVAIAKKRALSMEKEWMACRSVEVDEDDIEIEGSEDVYTGRREVISERERRRRREERGL